MSITIPLNTDDTRKVSDGYHTFEGLYDHRILLFINLVVESEWKAAWMPHYPGWPVLFVETPEGQISYHFLEKYLHLIERNGIKRDDNYKWDGHTPNQVIERLCKCL